MSVLELNPAPETKPIKLVPDVTPKLRYTIDITLWNSFTYDRVMRQINRLYETGRVVLPGHDKPFSIRLDFEALLGGIEDAKEKRRLADEYKELESLVYVDFIFSGSDDVMKLPACVSFAWVQVMPGVARGVPLDRRQDALDALAKNLRGQNPEGWTKDRDIIFSQWLEKDTLVLRDTPRPGSIEIELSEDFSYFASREVLPVLMILLQDAQTNRVIIEPRVSKLHKLGIGKRRLAPGDLTPEIVLHIPKRIYTGEHGGTHASPHFHYREEHERDQAIGKRGEGLNKRITIAGTWINAADILPEERGEPIRMKAYTLKR